MGRYGKCNVVLCSFMSGIIYEYLVMVGIVSIDIARDRSITYLVGDSNGNRV